MFEGVKWYLRKPGKYSWVFGSEWKCLGALPNLGRAPNPWERRAVSLMVYPTIGLETEMVGAPPSQEVYYIICSLFSHRLRRLRRRVCRR